MTHVTGPVAIVTGGSQDPGHAAARALAGRGYAVAVVYLHRREEAEAAVEEILRTGGTALTVRADVTDELDVERVFGETAAVLGGVDVLVHMEPRGLSVVCREAARQLPRGGAILSRSRSRSIDPGLADALTAQGITVNGLPPGREPAGADHDVAELVAMLDDRHRGPRH